MNEKTKNKEKRYLLILSCSKRKKLYSSTRAIDLYDGPFYRMIRKNKPENLDILIISAKYGLIEYNEKISHYEQIMDDKRARELTTEVCSKLEGKLENTSYDCVALNLGRAYMLTLEKCKELLNRHNVYWIDGQIGERLHKLKKWLNSINAEMGKYND